MPKRMLREEVVSLLPVRVVAGMAGGVIVVFFLVVPVGRMDVYGVGVGRPLEWAMVILTWCGLLGKMSGLNLGFVEVGMWMRRLGKGSVVLISLL